MGAPDVLGLLVAKGLTIRPLPDGSLEVSPRRLLTDDLRALIRANKAVLLETLRIAQERTAGQPASQTQPEAPGRSQDEEDAAVEDLREHFEERAGILEHDGNLPRSEAECEAAKATADLARTRGYSWSDLSAALPPALARGLPSGPGPVEGLPLGLQRWAVTPEGDPVQQGPFRVVSVQ